MSSENKLKKNSQVVGVLLLYYAPYVGDAIRYFTELLQSTAPNSVLIIVKNQDLQLPPTQHPCLHVIDGNNTLHEFSGWQAGIEYCRSQQLIHSNGLVIFANDTFCHHNKFGPITRWSFRRSFKRVLKSTSRMALVGEVHPAGNEFSIGPDVFSEWVSTYLFAMTVPLLQEVVSVVPPLDLDQFFTGQTAPEKFLTGPLNDSLKQHLSNYLFGLRGSAKWYAAQIPSERNIHQFIGKAKSILCEMYLSAATASVGAEIDSVFNSILLFQARRLERLLPRHRKNSPDHR